MTEQPIFHYFVRIFAFVMHTAAYVIYMIAIRKAGIRSHMVRRSEADAFKRFTTQMAPNSWCEVIWQVTFPFMFSWLLSSFRRYRPRNSCNFNSNRCDSQRCDDSQPQCDSPKKGAANLSFLLYGLAMALQIPRVLLLGNDFHLASFFMALLSGILMLAAYVMESRLTQLIGLGCQTKCCSSRCFIFLCSFATNMMAAIAVWSIFYALANLAAVLVHFSPLRVSSEDAATGCLSVFLILVAVNIGLDLALFDRYNRYQFLGYIYQILAMACVLSNRNVPGSRNTILTIVILAMTSTGLAAKIVNCCVREYMEYRDRKQRVSSAPVEKQAI